ncbi:F-box only protein 21 [Leptinotarsa decemlineata]|uniref:F-box only protein 21 n=1 Tax=Leptinotarsa decemlineata TaxID=7539 RepID=UPI000C25304A|nr:F-box only protein 21-like [Leptinotarsa decemlineata]
MEQLPVEIIEKILIYSRVSIEDVVHFSMTCHHFYDIVMNSNKIWKTKLFHKWRPLKTLFENKHILFQREVRYIYELRQRTRNMLEKMPPKFYKKYEISDSDLHEWSLLLNERDEVYNYLVLDLMDIVNTDAPINSIEVVPLNTPGNKTLQYYASKVLRYIRQLHLSKVWKDYISLPESRQVLEIGAVFVAQWCQPNVEITFEDITQKLDKIADEVKTALRFSHPQHPIFKASQQELDLWKVENRADNQWNVDECRQLISVMRDVLFQQIGFSGNNHAYYMPQNSFINEVLEKRQGLPITLAIVFEAVARRLGLRCEPISFPAHFLLRFCESSSCDSDWYYIDVFNGGQVVRKGACPHSRFSGSRDLFPVATAVQVVERMANNLEVSARQHGHPNGRITRLRSSLELLKLVNPRDISALVSLARLYMLHNMDTKPLEHFLLSQEFEVPEQAQRVVHMLRDYEAHHARNDTGLFNQVEAAQRSPSLMYAVGMVMKHQTLNYKCVIYDWDPVCLAATEWQEQNNVEKLNLKGNQPFYNVLVEDGSHRYVAQENLIPTSDKEAIYLNDDVGRHFSHFFETHYVPNAEKEKEYPADKKVRHKFHHQRKLESFTL